MNCLILCDFGSTFTKLTAVDPEAACVVGTASAFTTVNTDIQEGFQKALTQLKEEIGEFSILDMKACSSAAGGLRMAVSGLVPELTAEAGRMAALGAGAKVIRVYSHEMTDEDMEELEEINPDIFLLTGGTDGGNSACILNNAERLAESSLKMPIIVAGNRTASSRIKKTLTAANKSFTICPNVMPRLEELNIEPVQSAIREIFLQRIIQAKGLSQISSMLSDIVMPTPAAVLAAMHLLADGTENQEGIGELLGVDPGGATTDVYSIASGDPQDMLTVLKGLPEPYEKRTVEGDIGMRYSLKGILEAVGVRHVAQLSGLTEEEVLCQTDEWLEHKDWVPSDEKQQRLDDALAASAILVAVRRHCGQIEEVYTPCGKTFAQTGKDLRGVKQVVVTGGAVIRSPHTQEIAQAARWSATDPSSLRPTDYRVLVDRRYILSAMGVLSQQNPDLALTIMKKELIHERD